MDKGRIIFLNGTSSSGKSSIAKALQNLLEMPFLHVSADDFLSMLPERFIDYLSGEAATEAELEQLRLYFPKVLAGFHTSLAAMTSEGNNLVVDYVFEQQNDLRICVEKLSDVWVLFVGVHCSLDELERREKGRDRLQGLARAQLGVVHAHGVYDVEVDTTQKSVEECAEHIKRVFDDTPEPDAFKRLRSALPG